MFRRRKTQEKEWYEDRGWLLISNKITQYTGLTTQIVLTNLSIPFPAKIDWESLSRLMRRDGIDCEVRKYGEAQDIVILCQQIEKRKEN